jgi:hypothetical protein
MLLLEPDAALPDADLHETAALDGAHVELAVARA